MRFVFTFHYFLFVASILRTSFCPFIFVPIRKMTSQDRPKVIIVGAGLGGVTLGLLLEHAGISYNIFERTTVFKPLGIQDAFTNIIMLVAEETLVPR